MAERDYTTKSRAKRIALDYFKRPHPLRQARLVLSIALPLAAALVVTVYAIRGDHRLYNSGPVSTAHSMFGARCEHCHAPAPVAAAGVKPASAFFVPVSKQACSVCHEGPIHQERQAFEPPCTNCHFEHKGRPLLVDFGDRQCTQCHAALTTAKGRSAFEREITGFQRGHPQFSVTLVRKTPEDQTGKKTEDPSRKTGKRVKLDDKTLRDIGETCLNHEIHQKANLFPRDDPRGEDWYRDRPGVIDSRTNPRLGCTYCHEADGQRAYMTPVKYETHCADCHALRFDSVSYPNMKAPHKEPDVVRAFLLKTYAEVPPKPTAKAPAATEEKPTRGGLRFKGRDEDQPEEGAKAGGGFKNAEAARFAVKPHCATSVIFMSHLGPNGCLLVIVC